jgi:hypothetical protein
MAFHLVDAVLFLNIRVNVFCISLILNLHRFCMFQMIAYSTTCIH